MNTTVRHKSYPERFVEWVFGLPNYAAILFVPLVLVIYFVALIINKVRGN